jgi:hypothetical protein
MFDRFSRSWALIKASATILKQDKHLLVFPLISAAALIAVVLSFALPVFGFELFEVLERGEGSDLVVYSVLLAFYVVQYFVRFFFNAALVGATMMRLDGGAPTVGDGLRIAASRIGPILGYAIIAATVGVILKAIQERVGFLGRIIVGMLGVGWSVATFLVVPTLVASNVGPIDAIRDSAGMLKKTWGENVIGQAGMGFAFGCISFAVVAIGLVLVGLLASTGSGVLAVLAVVLLVVVFLGVMLVQATLSGIYSAALYRYAANRDGTTGFDKAALESAFIPKQ